eukprot:NODE_4407_length_793_cov_43.052553_g4248_i0.p1 GENE.NODE_4407_length_793_cov_43.052553_g4248_i0~~NODE_4407_length_793_cov_43.052553_g4248_i0.p1  ORF type:complete len:227 (-),score=55.01 NODE_4407_length_793_cov_43.052553_g4248_i0:60-740(-)
MGSEATKLADQTPFHPDEIQRMRSKYYHLLLQPRREGRPAHKLDKATFSSNFTDPRIGGLAFELFDAGNTGEVDFREFVTILAVLMRGTDEEKVDCCFELYDCDHTGYISHENFTYMAASFFTVMRGLVEQQRRTSTAAGLAHQFSMIDLHQEETLLVIGRLFSTADKQQNGQISREEFRLFCKQHPQLLAPLTSVLRATQHACGWDWVTEAPAQSPLAPAVCSLM